MTSPIEALQYIEVDVDRCGLTYGVAPCNAAIGLTGDRKCFNSLATCQDRAHFTDEPVTVRYSVPTRYLPATIESIPAITGITYDPAAVSLGQNLGERASVTVTMMDFPSPDSEPGGDPYLASRPYNPYERGSYFGKFRKRRPYLRGRALRWINGYTGQQLADMEVRHFIVDSITGPSRGGEFKLIAKDILKLADGERAQAPAVSAGFLNVDVNESALTFPLAPVGVGSTYQVSGWAAIGGKEIVAYARSGDTMTITQRGAFNTVAAQHKAQDRVQEVLRYAAQDPAVIIHDLLVNYAGVPAEQIDLSQWQNETITSLNRLYSATLAQPTSVNALISELIEQAGLSVWPDDRENKIGLLVLRSLVPMATDFSRENTMADSIELAEQPDKRLSQVHIYFGQINPLTSLNDKANFRSVSQLIDVQAEADYGSAVIKEIFSRWIPDLGRVIADRVGNILLARFRDPPRNVKAKLLRYSTNEIKIARTYNLTTRENQDDTGAEVPLPFQVTRLRALADVWELEGYEALFKPLLALDDNPNNRSIIIDANNFNLNLRNTFDLFYPAPVAGLNVTCIIHSGVIVGSSNFGLPAFDIGIWPVGVNITLVLESEARIMGSGGPGGQGNNPSGLGGYPGGPALYTRYPITLNSAGKIWSGGGGGGAKRFAGWGGVDSGTSAGGGGGAGQLPNVGGSATFPGGNATIDVGGAPGQYVSPTDTAGRGGDPGQDGGTAAGGYSNGAGGLKGAAIDGVSFITTLAAGDIRGSQIN